MRKFDEIEKKLGELVDLCTEENIACSVIMHDDEEESFSILSNIKDPENFLVHAVVSLRDEDPSFDNSTNDGNVTTH